MIEMLDGVFWLGVALIHLSLGLMMDGVYLLCT